MTCSTYSLTAPVGGLCVYLRKETWINWGGVMNKNAYLLLRPPDSSPRFLVNGCAHDNSSVIIYNDLVVISCNEWTDTPD